MNLSLLFHAVPDEEDDLDEQEYDQDAVHHSAAHLALPRILWIVIRLEPVLGEEVIANFIFKRLRALFWLLWEAGTDSVEDIGTLNVATISHVVYCHTWVEVDP